MHEVALATQLAAVVRRAARGRRVESVSIEVGALRQVVPESLEFAWTFVNKGTTIAGAALAVTWVPGRLQCPAGHVAEFSGEFSVLCPICGQRGAIIDGEQFRVLSIDVLTGS